MRVLIYGGGAVGLGVASCLIKSGVETSILVHNEARDLLRKEGLFREGIFGEFHAKADEFQAISEAGEAGEKPFDFIIVCVKSFDSAFAAKELSGHKELLSPEGRIVLFQNGWGNAEVFLQYFGKPQVYNARVITGFSRPAKNRVTITVHAEPIHVGSLFEDTDSEVLRPLCEAVTAGGIPCEAVKEVGKDIWAKMLYNCALNPLGAIFKVSYGTLAQHEYSRDIMNQLIGEIYEVMKAAGYRTHWDSPEEYLDVFYRKLVPPTAGHKSSTLQSLLAGQKTEIDALTGAIVKLGREYKIALPGNELIYKMIRFEEAVSQKS